MFRAEAGGVALGPPSHQPSRAPRTCHPATPKIRTWGQPRVSEKGVGAMALRPRVPTQSTWRGARVSPTMGVRDLGTGNDNSPR
eukprot:6187720-Pleurochrysis_carterae.AAC.2